MKKLKDAPTDAPDLDIEGVQRLLGYASTEQVRILARKGSSNGGIDPYIWVKKTDGTYAWVKKAESILAGRPTSVHPNMFYRSEIEEWSKNHPVRDKKKEITYTPEQRDSVVRAICENSLLENGNGRVHRAKLFELLHKSYGWAHSSPMYGKLAKILNDQEIPGYRDITVTKTRVR